MYRSHPNCLGSLFLQAGRPIFALLLLSSGLLEARNVIGGGGSGTSSSQNGSSSASATSQTASAATAAAAQAAQAAAVASRAQDSLVKSTTAFQTLQQAQQAAAAAALANPNKVLGSPSAPLDGIVVGGLDPKGGVPATQASSIQVVNLSGSSKNQLALGNGGSIALPNGTSGKDQITISGAGSVTGGSVTATSGSLATTSGGTLAATNGGSVSLTAGSGSTLTASTSVTITPTLAGTVTLSSGTKLTFSANQAITVPAGSTVALSGTGIGTVAVSGSGTLSLAGAGTLSLANTTSGSGGTIVTNTGQTSFTSGGTLTSLTAGSMLTLTGAGTLKFTGTGSDVLPVILEPTSTSNLTTPAFTTTGTLLSTTGYSLSGLSWTGVDALSQSVSSGSNQTTVTVTQDAPQALLNWTTFNVGRNTTLDFDQSAGGVNVSDWIAINRILDPSLAPSRILGTIDAPGQVYVVNQNGIVFTGSVQVNTHALVASTLPMNSNLISSGLLNNPNGQYLFTSVAIPALGSSTAYDPSTDPNVLPGATSQGITVEEGANLYSPGSSVGVGGKIALIAPTVTNQGELSAPDGQIILAAGQQVGFVAHPSSDASLRGLDVAVGQGPGTATNGNTGLIYAPEADVTMTGLNVNQMGEIESLTSVALNGRIDLLAVGELAPDPQNSYIFDATLGSGAVGGTVDLGPNSFTAILPDYSDTATQVGTSLALPSQVYVAGQNFHMESGAQLIAPAATATFSLGILNTPITTTAARINDETPPLAENTGATASGQAAIPELYLNSPGQVTLDAGANIDVSGSSNVQASAAENIVSAQLTQAVLENSPLQESGPLRGQTVEVDISLTGTNPDGSTWYGSPIGDLSGYANLVNHTVGELTVDGGSVSINTNGAVAMNTTSSINVSGGSIDYQGANVQTTKVITSSGQVINISQATPDQLYQGVDNGFTVSSEKFGTSTTYTSGLKSSTYYDPGYVEGGSAGTLSISSASATLSGSLSGNTTIGARQQSTPPTAGTFSYAVQPTIAGANPTAINVVIQPGTDSETTANTTYLSPDLFGADGFANATINSGSGTITIASDSVIQTATGGSLNLTAANVNVDGQVYLPSGSISITALAKDPLDISQNNATSYDPTIGNIDVAPGAVLSTSGLTFDETSNTTPGTLPFSVQGGSIALSGASTTLAQGSVMDASGGAAREVNGKIVTGKGGSISLSGYYNGTDTKPDGQLTLAGTLSAYGIGQGGSLTLKAPAVQVGGTAGEFSPAAATLLLPADFFSQGGFSTFSVNGQAGVQILSSVAPILTEEITNGNGRQLLVEQVSSADLPQFPAAPVSLSFAAPGSTGSYIGEVMLGSGDAITTGPTGSVSLSGQLVDVLGNITTPGGKISIAGATTQGLTGTAATTPDVTVYLGPEANLNTSGIVLTTPTAGEYAMYQTGEVLSGGTISLTGNIAAAPGSSLVADGTTGRIDVPYNETAEALGTTGFSRSTPYVLENVASNGGSISLNGDEELYFGGNLSAKAGNASAVGGSLTVASGLTATNNVPPNAGFAELFISQSGLLPIGTVTLGSPLANLPSDGGGFFTIDQFAAGGFGSLILKGNVEFDSSVNITASQEVEIIPDSLNGTIFANPSISNASIDISAPYIAIGATTLDIDQQSVSAFAPSYVQVGSGSSAIVQASPTPGLAAPTFGSATLSLDATDLIDVGFLSLQNFGTTNFSVPTGDIRGGGLLYAAGTLNLTAGQIYTPTAATFTIAAFDAGSTPGTINIFAGSARPLPYSAGGTINVYATDINQDGVIEAPFGTINLGALPDLATGLTPVLPGVDFVFNTSSQSYQGETDVTQYAPQTQQLTLGKDSIASVSGVSSTTGEVLDLPYGTILNGNEWIAPNGANITAGGLPVKAVNVEGVSVTATSGSLVDLAGGGDLFAYQFSPGVNGTNDILSVYKYANGAVVESSSNVPVYSNSFAIVPTYGIDYAPVDLTVDSTGAHPYAANPTATADVGEQIYLAGGDGLAAGTYTVLPARYGLLPGAFLVTPTTTGAPTQAAINPDGSAQMGGYLFNSLTDNQQIIPQVGGFEVDPSSVIHSRAEYDIASANTFLAASATANNQPVPRLPMDAGQLVFSATESLNLQPGASIAGTGAGTDGLGSQVDISSSSNIEINDTGVDANFDGLVLDAGELTSLDASSLLIGGFRQSTSTGTVVNVTTSDLLVNNTASSVLQAGDLILVSNGNLTVTGGSALASAGSTATDDLSVLNSGTGAVTVTSSSTGSDIVTLASAMVPSSFGVGASFLGSTVQSINGNVVTLARNADVSAANQAETFSGNRVTVASSSTGSSTVSLASSSVPADFGVGSSLLGSTVESINGNTVTLAANANASVSGTTESYSSSDGALLRISGDTSATIARAGGVNTADTFPSLSIASGASITGNSLILDSTGQSSLNSTLNVGAISINAGRISVELDNGETLQPDAGLVISAAELASLQTNTKALALASYSSIDFYGSGIIGGAAGTNGQYPVASFTLDAAAIRGFTTSDQANLGGGNLVVNAQDVILNNAIGGTAPGATVAVPNASSFTINAGTINFGANNLTVDGFSAVNLNATTEMLLSGAGGLATQGSLNLATPMVTASTGANFGFNAQGGNLALSGGSGSATASSPTGGLGATISLTGENVNIGSIISAPTGTINATATAGDLEVQSTGDLIAVGKAVTFGDVVSCTNGGDVNLVARGNVALDAGSAVDVSAQAGGGNAGNVAIAAQGTLTVAAGSLKGTAGTGGTGGSFQGTFSGQSGQTLLLAGITTPLTDGGFQSISLDVLGSDTAELDGAVGATIGNPGLSLFSLTSESGQIVVDQAINASGTTGGTIDLFANQGVTLTANAVLSVAGTQLNAAGEGGTIDIETRGAGAAGSDAINIETGATLNLSVAGASGGTLHLRAPTSNGNSNLLIDSINGTIIGASSVEVEGYNVYDTSLSSTAGQNTSAGTGQINAGLEGSASTSTANDGTVYGDAEGFAANSSSILAALLNGTPNADQSSIFQVTPGAEIINPTGNLVLSADWDLSSFRFGPNNVAGDLTLRAANNLVFTGSLTDGFAYNPSDSENISTSAYTWDVLSGPSWSYRLVSGAQFDGTGASTANFGSVQSLTALGLNTSSLTNAGNEAGSLLLGKNIPVNFNYGTTTDTTASIYAQLIRTGTGSITIDTGGSVDLLNQLATIYTAGRLAPDLPGFDLPTGDDDSAIQTKVYGTTIAPAPQYTAQYTEEGGDISIDAQQDVVHLTLSNGVLVPDTSWQFPTNWLYRRGATSSPGVFDTTQLDSSEIATTTWWVDFSNFFEGIGALGGGNVSVKAGGNIVNVDAAVPTNARMPYADASGNPLPNVASNLVELGGGNLSVVAGGTILGGTYEVERGTGTIDANSITVNGDTARISAEDRSLGDNTPLPLTLFMGDSSFTVSATNDLRLGSTVNPFLLPQGIGNNFDNESVFSTYGNISSVSLSSLLGSVSIQGSELNIQGSTTEDPLPGSLYNAYFSNASPGSRRSGFTTEASLTRTPWTLTLDPTPAGTLFIDNVTDYSTFYELSPPIFNAAAYTGNIQYVSNQLLAPSAQGTVKLLAAGSIDGAFNSSTLGNGLTAAITVLDDDPSQIPSVTNPYGLGTSTEDPPNNPSIRAYINNVYALLGETPSYANQSFQILESYHTSGLLHDNSTTVQIDTIGGDIGDFTLISPERADISSGLDIQDVSFYLQNNNAGDISVVAANRDITLYDPNSAGLAAIGAANSTSVAYGDLQISGPGTLEVLAGRNLNLGQGTPPDNDVGTGLGITSIGQSRNPYLPFGGANLITAAGLGSSSSLGTSTLTFGNISDVNGTITPDDSTTYAASFIGQFLDPSSTQSSRYLPDLGAVMNLPSGDSTQQIWTAFASASREQQDVYAQDVFYEVLRDAGRDHNNPASPNAGTYDEGYAAIAALFPSGSTYQGDISLTSREIKTTNGGDIDMLVPGGGIEVGLNNFGTQAIDQGILTVDGGNISIFTHDDVNIGTSRIFTLHGGNIIIWSTDGNIDAGASSRTVQSAPPTRVLVDPQSANVETDLAGLATGGGIGVLETVVGAPPGNVDLIAPVGTVNAGDAGIRSSGNINVAAAQVLNAGNIQASGSTTGVPTTSTPNIAATVAASSAAGATQNASAQMAQQQQSNQAPVADIPSIVNVEVLGYGGGDDDSASNQPGTSTDLLAVTSAK